MTIVSRRKNETMLGRLWRAWLSNPVRSQHGIVSADQFQHVLACEISRSNRRQFGREFALIHLSFDKSTARVELSEKLVGDFRDRVRISDSIGWHRSTLAVLLPETNREGAGLVARELIEIASRYGKQMSAAVYIYPWDEELVAICNEFAHGEPADPQWAFQHESLKPNQDPESSDPRSPLNGHHRHDSGLERDSRNGNSIGNGNGHHLQSHLSNLDNQDLSAASSLRYGPSGSGVAVLDSEFATAKAAVVLRSVNGTRLERTARSQRRLVVAPQVSTELNRLASVMSEQPTPWWKRAIDILGSGAGLLVLSPVLLLAAVAIKLNSRGPILFRQLREGKGGKPFAILKFRTMVPDAEQQQESLRTRSEQDGPAFKLKDDPRVTTVGKYLRKSCIDELPQLVNVVLGQMSLVGPRPLPVGESHACHAWQRMRLTVLPGLTCTWQIQGGRNVKFEKWMRMDLEYIRKRSFLYDLKLIVKTALLVLLHRGSV